MSTNNTRILSRVLWSLVSFVRTKDSSQQQVTAPAYAFYWNPGLSITTGLAQWWGHHVGWVCCFRSTLLREDFPLVSWSSSLTKNHSPWAWARLIIFSFTFYIFEPTRLAAICSSYPWATEPFQWEAIKCKCDFRFVSGSWWKVLALVVSVEMWFFNDDLNKLDKILVLLNGNRRNPSDV